MFNVLILKVKKKTKEINCQQYYEEFEKFAIKYIDSIESKN